MKRSLSKGLLALGPSILLFALCLSFANAQTPGTIDGTDITVTPQNPAPGNDVTISISDYLNDISAADISWLVNGKKVAEGIGMTNVHVTAPPLGSESDVTIAVRLPSGQTLEKSVTVTSGQVDMVWESEGYAPPLYQGKQGLAYQSTIRIIAVPHLVDGSGQEIDPSNLVYTWKENGSALQAQSGYGKDALELQGGVIPRPFTIDVSVASADGQETGAGEMDVAASDPSIILYRDDPLYGVLYNLAVGAQTVFTNQEITLLASPFSFDLPSQTDNNLQYDWTINGQAQPSLTGNRSVTLRVQDTSQDSTYPVDLQIQNSGQILQGGTQSVNVLYKAGTAQSHAISL